MKKYPKLKFDIQSNKGTVGTISYFLHPRKKEFDWSGVILNCYPELAKKLKSSKNKKDNEKIIYNFFSDLKEKIKIKINKKLIV